MIGLLAALVAALVGVLGGYRFGIAQARQERRDAAIAEVFKEAMLFYRSTTTWTISPTSSGPITDPDIPWEDYCKTRYAVFVDVFYGNSIWLGSDTHDLIQNFAAAGADVLNELRGMGNDGKLPNGSSAYDLRAAAPPPRLDELEEALRSEVEASRYIIPFSARSTRRRKALGDGRVDG